MDDIKMCTVVPEDQDINLASSGYLIGLRITAWTNSAKAVDHTTGCNLAEKTAKDNSLGNNVLQQHKKRKISDEAFEDADKKLNKIKARAYGVINRMSIGLDGDLGKYLPTESSMYVNSKLAEYEKEYFKWVDIKVTRYVEVIADMDKVRTEQGMLFNPNEYPSEEEVRNQHTWTVERMPVPESGFICDLEDDRKKLFERKFNKLLDRIVTDGGESAKEQLLAQATKLSNDLGKKIKSEQAKAEGIKAPPSPISDSVFIDTTKEICLSSRGKNLTKDPVIEKASSGLLDVVGQLPDKQVGKYLQGDIPEMMKLKEQADEVVDMFNL